MEIGIGQAETIEKMISADVWEEVTFLKDLQGIPRTLKMSLKSSNLNYLLLNKQFI
jgi:hypothetical protein